MYIHHNMNARLPRKASKKRFQITLSGPVAKAGRELARRERRSFSNVLEVLIDRATAEEPSAR